MRHRPSQSRDYDYFGGCTEEVGKPSDVDSGGEFGKSKYRRMDCDD